MEKQELINQIKNLLSWDNCPINNVKILHSTSEISNRYIKILLPKGVTINLYHKETGSEIGEFALSYEELNETTLNEILDCLHNQFNLNNQQQ